MKKLPLPLADYQRISRIIASVLDGADAKTAGACLFFAVAGALILERKYGITARPAAGAAFYRVNDKTGFTIAYADMSGVAPQCSDAGFHCWVETVDGHAIDFMAPIFQDSVRARGRSETVPCRMFQRHLSEMSPSPFDLSREGDFYFAPDRAMTARLLEEWLRLPGNSDLANMCLHWLSYPAKKCPSSITMGSNDGTIKAVTKRTFVLEGAW